MTEVAAETSLKEHIRGLLTHLGENPDREGLLDTPERVEKSLKFLTEGHQVDVEALLAKARFTEAYEDMVLVKDIDFFSMCEHHMIPFFGKAHVAYIPDGQIIGLSKIPRLVDAFARRLQVQERLTCQIAESLQEHLNPKGVAVVLEAQHLCAMMRGVQKINNKMTTSSMLGIFRNDSKTRMEFLSLIGDRQNL